MPRTVHLKIAKMINLILHVLFKKLMEPGFSLQLSLGQSYGDHASYYKSHNVKGPPLAVR